MDLGKLGLMCVTVECLALSGDIVAYTCKQVCVSSPDIIQIEHPKGLLYVEFIFFLCCIIVFVNGLDNVSSLFSVSVKSERSCKTSLPCSGTPSEP